MALSSIILWAIGVEIIILLALSILAYWKNHTSRFDQRYHVYQKKNVHKAIVFFVYLIVVTAIIYLLLLVFSPGSFLKDEYVINPDNPSNSLSTFYIENSNILKEYDYHGENVFEISSPASFNLVFKPKTNVANRSGTFTIDLYGGGGEFYLDNKLIIPNLEDYDLIGSYPEAYVFVHKEVNTKDYEYKTEVDEFIYGNFRDKRIYSQKAITDYNLNIDDFQRENTEINIAFRDSLKLAVYAQDEIDLSFTKQDLNNYLGQDEYTLIITSQKGEVVFNHTYMDDGDNKASRRLGEEQRYNEVISGIEGGIYTIEFQKDVFNDAPDSTIKDITINTNKIIFLDRILPWEANTSYYANFNNREIIGFLYWQENNEQIIEINGKENIIIDLNKSWLSTRYDQNLSEQGDYYINIEKGFLWVYAEQLSLSKEGWFEIINTIDNIEEAEVIVLDRKNLEIEGNEFIYTKEVSVDSGDKFSLRSLQAGKYYIKEIKLVI